MDDTNIIDCHTPRISNPDDDRDSRFDKIRVVKKKSRSKKRVEERGFNPIMLFTEFELHGDKDTKGERSKK